jgi:hypothetical protein
MDRSPGAAVAGTTGREPTAESWLKVHNRAARTGAVPADKNGWDRAGAVERGVRRDRLRRVGRSRSPISADHSAAVRLHVFPPLVVESFQASSRAADPRGESLKIGHYRTRSADCGQANPDHVARRRPDRRDHQREPW